MEEDSRLREHYGALSTDELLDISVSGGLTEVAKLLLDEELARRGASAVDYAAAKAARARIDADRERNTKRFLFRIRLAIIFLVVIAMIGICIEFFLT